ncbi:MAG: hypothetical protein BZY81_08350 [SAR202 cluster bacterium Io17-Chloro-G4]|nr:MAG: hypothetical protein BZY81_08350 [SAR202 cluster bacterium Io17-Chloro-G4]
MSRLFFSLQFRLVLGFAMVFSLALASVSWYVGYAAQKEADRFQQGLEDARAARIERVISRIYTARQDWTGLQTTLEEAGSLYGWRIVVSDSQGQVVGRSHQGFDFLKGDPRHRIRFFPVRSRGREVGSVGVAPSDLPGVAPEPAVSRLVAELDRSLLWTGLSAGIVGILLVSLVSRRVLAPVRSLNSAARRWGQGELSQRVSAPGRGEIGQLARSFNSMAEELESAERQRRSLMADVAHELRTPLSNIQGYLEAVRDGLLQPDSSTIDTIYQQVIHLTHLVEDLRVLALAEAGALALNWELDSMEDLLRRSVDSFGPRAEAKGIDLSLMISGNMYGGINDGIAEGQPTLPLLEMDRTRISQVVANLMENAIVHTPAGGTVTISADLTGELTGSKSDENAHQDSNMIRVSVADTGPGLAPQELGRVFHRFYRQDASRSRSTGGVGLGLTISKQLVEAHGGSIIVESSLGEGSRFGFQRPLTRPISAGNSDNQV